MKIRFLLPFIAVALFFGCREDIIENNTLEIVSDPEVFVKGKITGIVTDQTGQALEGVSVAFFNHSTATDENGYFSVASAEISEGGSLVVFSKQGYFAGYKFVNGSIGAASFIRAKMVPRQSIGTLDATSGGTLTAQGGAIITFQPNSIVHDNGGTYNGAFNVYAHWYDPASADLYQTMPGDLRGVSTSSELVQLATLGMWAVELESASGQKLQLDDNTPAQLTFPVPVEWISDAPQEIPLWSMDEGTGYWKEEGSAQLVNGMYQGAVSHFSFWNCDVPFPLIEMKGTLVDTDGNPLPWTAICISFANAWGTGYGWTDEFGNFSGKVPKNETLLFEVKDACGNIVFSQTIGPFSSNVSLGEIAINLSDHGVQVNGRLVDCDGNPISEGYLLAELDNGEYTIIEAGENGEFSGTVLSCSAEMIEFTGYDIASAKTSETITVDASSNSVFNLGDIIVCEALEEYIIFMFDNGPQNLIPEPECEIVNGNVLLAGGNPNQEVAFNVQILDAIVGSNAINNLYAAGVGESGTFNVAFCSSMDSTGVDGCDDFELTITTLGLVGDFVIGEFVGSAYSNAGNMVQLSGSFKVRIDAVVEYGSIQGRIWEDQNENGLQDPGEPGLAQVVVLASRQNNVFSAITDGQGVYNITIREPGLYEVFMEPQFGYRMTEKDVGNDDTIDSDFNPNSWATDAMTLQSAEDIFDVDGGLIPSAELECVIAFNGSSFCDEVSLSIVVFGGTAPYTYEWSSGNSEAEVTVVAGDVYAVTVTDANGVSCVHEVEVPPVPSITCFADIEVLECDNGNISADIFVWADPNTGGGINYSFLWNTGQEEDQLLNVGPGIYTVTVVDENGCQCTSSVEVPGSLGAIGNQVWLDFPGGSPNEYDGGDVHLDSVQVELYLVSGGSLPVQTQLTNLDGKYLFQNVEPGDYYVKFIPPPGYVFVEKDYVSDDSKDSDADRVTGETDVFTYDGCSTDLTWDAGLKIQ